MSKQPNIILAGLCFGTALGYAKDGYMIAREGWNGQGMFAYVVPAASYPAQTGVAKSYFGEDATVPYRAYLALKTVDGSVATWAPSGSDVLAEDWIVLAFVEQQGEAAGNANMSRAAQAQLGTGDSDLYAKIQAKAECLRMATGLVSSGNVAKNSDPVELARQFYEFVSA